MNTDHRITINLNERQYQALDKASQITGLSYCAYIRQTLNTLAYSLEKLDEKMEVCGDANVETFKPSNL